MYRSKDNKKSPTAPVKLAEEIKNKKNESNFKRLNQVDDKPVDFDDGKLIKIQLINIELIKPNFF
jgi:hypothetical protein